MKRPGFTLVEIVLALGLTVVVVGLAAMAVGIHLRVADAARNAVEEPELARFVLQRMGDDLRNAVLVTPTSPSAATGSGSQSGSSQSSSQTSSSSSTTTQSTTSQSSSSDLTDEPWSGGLRGTSQELQLDISHMPLFSGAAAAASSGGGLASIAPPSDVRTVTYRVVRPEDAGPIDASGVPGRPCGLLRGEWERATFAWAMQQGQTADLDRALKSLAPQVEMIEFAYIDNGTTYDQWDSFEQGKLPTAVHVAIAMRRPARAGQTTGEQPATVYEMLVYLPNANCTPGQAASSGSQQSTTTSQDSSSSGSSAGSGTVSGASSGTVSGASSGTRSGTGSGTSSGTSPGTSPGSTGTRSSGSGTRGTGS